MHQYVFKEVMEVLCKHWWGKVTSSNKCHQFIQKPVLPYQAHRVISPQVLCSGSEYTTIQCAVLCLCISLLPWHGIAWEFDGQVGSLRGRRPIGKVLENVNWNFWVNLNETWNHYIYNNYWIEVAWLCTETFMILVWPNRQQYQFLLQRPWSNPVFSFSLLQ